MKPSLIAALIPVCVFATAMFNGARAENVAVHRAPSVVTQVVAVARAEPVPPKGANTKPDEQPHVPKSQGSVTPAADARSPAARQP